MTKALTKVFPYAVLIAFLVTACGDKKKNDVAPPSIVKAHIFDTTTPTGLVVDTLNTRVKRDQSYAIYLPKQYDTTKTWPLLAGFDSHARGAEFVSKYKDIAEKEGVILAISNSSQNGMTGEQTIEIAGFMINDLKSRFAVDSDLIYLTGFSGGSRVASAYATRKAGVAGVIGCGAGISDQRSLGSWAFEYLGIVGREDFNLLEMRNLDYLLKINKVHHYILEFAGGHEWPDTSTMAKAFVWMKASAMRRGALSRNENWIESSIQNLMATGSSMDEKSEYENLRLIVAYFEGLANVNAYRAEAREIEQRASYKKYLQEVAAIQSEEQNQQKELGKAFPAGNVSWWNAKIASIKKGTRNANPERAQMNQRLLNYMSLTAYMYSTTAVSQNATVEAEKFLGIYKSVDPENPEPHFLLAKLHANNDEDGHALAALNAAVNLGFKDLRRLRNDPDFIFLTGNEQFLQIQEKMAKK